MANEENDQNKEAPKEKGEKKPGAKGKYRRFIRWFWILLLTPLLGFIGLVIGIALFADLPDIDQLQNPESNLATVVYSSDGKELGRFYAENRVNVKYKEVDTDIIHALVATEDERYFDHSGIDLRDRKSTRLNSSHIQKSRMPSSA